MLVDPPDEHAENRPPPPPPPLLDEPADEPIWIQPAAPEFTYADPLSASVADPDPKRGRRRSRHADRAGDGRVRTEKPHTAKIARWHGKVVERSADVALAAMPVPLRVLDVGCGTGGVLREMIVRVPYAHAYFGIDPDRKMIASALDESDPRITFVLGSAEALPFPDRCFDLVVTSLSLHHWADQSAGVAELARVVKGTGKVVVVDLSATWLRRKRRARTPKQMRTLLDQAGLRVDAGETLYRLAYSLPMVRAFIASS
jgi:ubiquinone/menaquinone biosynthesis C-methylase UbiE